MNIQQIRQQYPQYADISDAELARLLRQRFYPQLDQEDFNQRIGLTPERGIIPGIQLGAERLVSTGRTALGSIFDANQAAQAGVERGQEISTRLAPSASLERVMRLHHGFHA